MWIARPGTVQIILGERRRPTVHAITGHLHVDQSGCPKQAYPCLRADGNLCGVAVPARLLPEDTYYHGAPPVTGDRLSIEG